MKTKGIGIFEQHVEKIVVGVAAAVFFSVLAWQLTGTSNNVQMGGESVAPSEADAKLRAAASTLSGRPMDPRKEVSDRLSPQARKFAEALDAGIAADGALPRIEPRLASALQSDGTAAGKPYHDARIAAAGIRPVLQVSDTFEAATVSGSDELKALFTNGAGPFDITWTVPSADVDLKGIRSELASTARGLAIPTSWYANSLFVIDVAFEREQMNDDGTWGPATLVAPLPGQFSFRPEIAKGADAGLRDSAWKYLEDRGNQRRIVQPDFLPTKGGNFSAAMLLTTGGAVAGEDPETRSLRKELAKRSLELKRLSEELESLGGPLEDQSREDRKREEERKRREEEEAKGNGGGGGGGGGMGRPGGGLGSGAGGMSGGKRGTGNEDGEKNKDRRIRLTTQKKALESKVQALEEKLGAKLSADEAEKARAAAEGDSSSDLNKADNFVVWAHDIGVRPGETYRYRATLKLYNPFFSNGAFLVKDQAGLDDSFTLDSEASDWSDPVRVSPPIEFFVIDAAAGEGKLGLGEATIDVYCYYDGERHRERFKVQPGETIGARKGSVNFATDFYLVDVFADPATDRGGADRRPAALAIVQSATGDRYALRVPKSEAASDVRAGFEDEIEIAKTNKSLNSGGEGAGTGGEKAGGAAAGS